MSKKRLIDSVTAKTIGIQICDAAILEWSSTAEPVSFAQRVGRSRRLDKTGQRADTLPIVCDRFENWRNGKIKKG